MTIAPSVQPVSKSTIQELFLLTFAQPRTAEDIPAIPDILPYKNWEEALGEPPLEHTERLLKSGVIEPASLEDSLDYLFTKQQIQEQLQARSLPISGSKLELIERLVFGDAQLAKDLTASKVLLRSTNSWTGLADRLTANGWGKAVLFILGAAASGIIGNRSDAALQSFIETLRSALGSELNAQVQSPLSLPQPASPVPEMSKSRETWLRSLLQSAEADMMRSRLEVLERTSSLRTTGTLYNSNRVSVAASITFYPENGDAPITSSLTLQPGETLKVEGLASGVRSKHFSSHIRSDREIKAVTLVPWYLLPEIRHVPSSNILYYRITHVDGATAYQVKNCIVALVQAQRVQYPLCYVKCEVVNDLIIIDRASFIKQVTDHSVHSPATLSIHLELIPLLTAYDVRMQSQMRNGADSGETKTYSILVNTTW